MHCVADFCIIPVGVSASVTQYIAEAQRVLEKTGLKVSLRNENSSRVRRPAADSPDQYELHGYGTGIEGDWDDVMTAIKQVHEALHKMGVPRCATDIRIGQCRHRRERGPCCPSA